MYDEPQLAIVGGLKRVREGSLPLGCPQAKLET